MRKSGCDLRAFGSDNRKSKIQKRPRRRKWVGLFAIVVALAVCGARADAQQAEKMSRIGFLDPSNASSSAVRLAAFRQELSKLGWIEGKNITIEYRFAEEKSGRQPELAVDLVRLKVDVIVGASTSVVLAAKRATTTIPIVFTSSSDPVGAGLVASLARPGGNVTGLSGLGVELNTKRLEVLKDAVPKLARVGLLRPPQQGAISDELQVKELRLAAVTLKLKLEEMETKLDPKSLESAFQRAKQKQVDAIMTISRPFSLNESGSSSLPANSGYRLSTSRRSMSMRVVSCPTGRTPLISIGARLFMWTRF